MLDTPFVRELVSEVRHRISAAPPRPKPARRSSRCSPTCSRSETGSPKTSSATRPTSGMGGGIGQWLLFRSADRSLCLFSLVVRPGRRRRCTTISPGASSGSTAATRTRSSTTPDPARSSSSAGGRSSRATSTAAPAARRHPPGAHDLGRHLGLDPPARERRGLHPPPHLRRAAARPRRSGRATSTRSANKAIDRHHAEAAARAELRRRRLARLPPVRRPGRRHLRRAAGDRGPDPARARDRRGDGLRCRRGGRRGPRRGRGGRVRRRVRPRGASARLALGGRGGLGGVLHRCSRVEAPSRQPVRGTLARLGGMRGDAASRTPSAAESGAASGAAAVGPAAPRWLCGCSRGRRDRARPHPGAPCHRARGRVPDHHPGPRGIHPGPAGAAGGRPPAPGHDRWLLLLCAVRIRDRDHGGRARHRCVIRSRDGSSHSPCRESFWWSPSGGSSREPRRPRPSRASRTRRAAGRRAPGSPSSAAAACPRGAA